MRLRSGFGLREVDFGRDLRLHVLAAHHRLQNIQNAAVVGLLELLNILQLLRVDTGAAVRTIGGRRQQLAGVVEHAHRRRRQFGNTRCHQMDDARQLRTVQRATGIQAHQHGSRGLLLLAEKAVLVGQGQVDPCALHR